MALALDSAGLALVGCGDRLGAWNQPANHRHRSGPGVKL